MNECLFVCLPVGPCSFQGGHEPRLRGQQAKSLSRQTSMLKGTDRCQQVLISEASISASVTPQLERMLQVWVCRWV